jgi:hypothetical protein
MTFTVPVTIATDAAETEGLRHARDFDPDQAADWENAAFIGRTIGYEDAELLNILDAFAIAIWRQTNTALSKATEARIAAFVADKRIVAVNHGRHSG